MSGTTSTRYPASIMLRARKLREAGWHYKDIARMLGNEFGVEPSKKTVERWTIPDGMANRRRLYQAEWAARNRPFSPRPVTKEWSAARMRELAAAGLGPAEIAKVAQVLWRVDTTPQAVKQAVRRKSHCSKGHRMTAANTYVDGRGTTRCRQCVRLSDRKRRELRKAA